MRCATLKRQLKDLTSWVLGARRPKPGLAVRA